ncbi:GHKL domain-containing protein [Mediterraneibacter glycyrrhizinilyticus]|uniref:GHKL domain-containing protein n=1 Tax=Mediterraneibacter glycyrrhizinilyticus TaxID=342942 RepID=UPI00195F456C|nr:GHKL domain-containing protein [Mediterraneibacter glycyrrhizinilyticus]MBM6752139.1 GHKL domain-containing protein [Mediterraneibacter glycyrrhizinilyticus]
MLSNEVEILEQSEKIQAQQDLELRILKQDADRKKKDFLQVMHELLDLLNSPGAKASEKYIHKLTSADSTIKTYRYCQDSFIDLILLAKKEEAERYGIHVEYQICLPSPSGKCSLTYPQLSSIFFNLLNNGIESCRNSGDSSPFLHLKVTFKSEILQIHMENSKSSVIKFNGQTTKTDKPLHGAGLKIIEKIAEEHHGFCVWKDSKDTFVSDILLDHTVSSTENPGKR